MNYIDEFRDPAVAARFFRKISDQCAVLAERGRRVKIMEICGSHTMAIGRFGIREKMPGNVELISGPGCPVCVTDPGYIDTAVALAQKDIILVTFGDMMRVPGSSMDLTECRAEGGDVRVCYSPAAAIEIAFENPDRQVVLLGIGFESTIAPIVAMIELALTRKVKNLSILTAFKLVPPAMRALLSDDDVKIDAFLCPAHVSTIIGSRAYETIVAEYHMPCVIAGFEPLDILYGTSALLDQLINNEARVENLYSRVVRPDGNRKAQELIAKYLESVDVAWRGMGVIPSSGLGIRKNFCFLDAEKRHGIPVKAGATHPGCRCGDVIKGKIRPTGCGLFGETCTPDHPVGPCMVSAEGTCSAYFKYRQPDEALAGR